MSSAEEQFFPIQKSRKGSKNNKESWCEICDKSFKNKLSKREHIKHVHGKIKNHRCNLCNMSFGQNIILQRHVNTVHKTLEAHKCDSCDKIFSVKANLVKHYTKVHEKIIPFKCDSWEKSFGLKGFLKYILLQFMKKSKLSNVILVTEFWIQREI